MTLATVTGTITDPSGSAVEGATVTAVLVSPQGAYLADDSAEILSRATTVTDEDGAWTLTLTPNAEIEPAGTYYRVTRHVHGKPQVNTISVPVSGSPVEFAAILVDASVVGGLAAGGVLAGTYPNPSFAVDMATQAELTAHVAGTTGVHGIADTSVLETATGSAAKVTAHAAAPLAEGANTVRLLNRLTADLDDVSILVVGDSTGDASTEWVRLVAATLAARYPAYTVVHHLWDTTGGVAYDTGAAGSATTIQTGTGSHTLHIWNCSVPGMATTYTLGSRWTAAVVTPAPDLVLISHGHNEGTVAAGTTASTWRCRMLTLTESIAAQHPLAAICLVLQNPRGDGVTDQQARARVYREIAALRGYGVIDAQSAFLAVAGYASTHVSGDGMHPTTTGSTLWADEVARSLVWSKDARPRLQAPSSLTTLGRTLLVNGTFTAFGSSVPDSWTATAATTAKDTRTGWFESATGWGVRIQASSAAQSYISQDVAAGLLPLVRGRRVTVAARIKVPSGQTSTAGRVQVADNVTNSASIGHADLRDGWHWAVSSILVDSAATVLRARVYADTASSSGADVTVDSVHLVLGALPQIGA